LFRDPRPEAWLFQEAAELIEIRNQLDEAVTQFHIGGAMLANHGIPFLCRKFQSFTEDGIG
jgi:hypothetical protein